MDRLSQLRGEAGGSHDSTLDTTSPPSESFLSANDSSSKYFSLSEVESTFDITSIKDVSLASTTNDAEGTITNNDDLLSNLSPIGKKSDVLEGFKIGKQIEAANILSGGVAIFDDNENSYDGDELVIDDNVDSEKLDAEVTKEPEEMENKVEENEVTASVGEAENQEEVHEDGGVEGDGDDEEDVEEEGNEEDSTDSEVVLQIDGRNVDAIHIGNGLYLYRKEPNSAELAAVQIIEDDQQQPTFKFLKVRENAEGNLEVYEEIHIEVPQEVPPRGKIAEKKISSHVPIKDINKVISENTCNQTAETPKKDTKITNAGVVGELESSPDSKSEVNFNGKMMKFSDSRKSPVVGSFTPMTYHSTPNKEGIPLTKTMVDQQLHPNRHSDNVKKTIEVHTDNAKQRPIDTLAKHKDAEDNKLNDIDIINDESVERVIINDEVIKETVDRKSSDIFKDSYKSDTKDMPVPRDQDNVIDTTEKDVNIALLEDIPVIDDKKENIISINECKENVEKIVEAETQITEALMENNSKDNLLQEKNVELKPNKENTIKEDVAIAINNEIALTVESNETEVKTTQDLKEEQVVKDAEATPKNVQDEINDKTVNDGLVNKEILIINDSKELETSRTKEDEINYEENDLVIDETPEINDTEKLEAKDDIVISSKIENLPSKIEEIVQVKNKDTQGEIKTVNTQILHKSEENIQVLPPLPEEINTKETGSSICAIVSESKAPEQLKSIQNKTEITDVSTHVADKPASDMLLTQIETTLQKQSEQKVKPDDKLKEIEKVSKHLLPKTDLLEIDKNKIVVNAEKKINKVSTDIAEIETSNAKIIHNKVDSAVEQKIETLEDLPIKQTKIENKAPTAENQDHKIDSKDVVTEVVQNKVVENSLKKEPVIAVQVLDTKPNITSTAKVDSTSDVKIETSNAQIIHNKVDSVERQKIETHEDLPIKQTKLENKSLTAEQNHKMDSKDVVTVKDKISEAKISKPPVIDLAQPSTSSAMYDVSSTSAEGTSSNSVCKSENDNAAEPSTSQETSTDGNKKAVPFGKWTATNRKEFLDKIRSRAPAAATPSTSNQLKNSNDLNRRDVLKIIDSQRQSSNALSKNLENNKTAKNETAFGKTNIVKDNIEQESNIDSKPEEVVVEAVPKPEINSAPQPDVTSITPNNDVQVTTATSTTKKESAERTEVNYQDLIDKTIEGMIHRTPGPPKVAQDELNQNSKDTIAAQTSKCPPNYQPIDSTTLDVIEMKMNELHGIPFIERPPHELPKVPVTELKTYSKADKEKQSAPAKATKIPSLLPFANKNQQKMSKDTIIDLDSEEEIIEHEPITGDININKKTTSAKPILKEKILSYTDKTGTDAAKKESNIITEKDFDKFARRNSITYENRLTVNYDGKESHNVIQTVVERDTCPKTYSKSDISRVDLKTKLPLKHHNVRLNAQPVKVHTVNKFGHNTDDSSNRSKLQKAYQSALTAKRQMECPITIIEDKPVKVVFMDHMEFVPSQLNVQGQDLSPVNKVIPNSNNVTVTTNVSLDSDVLDVTDDSKTQEENKIKTKHQRKQVLTPVEEPELELIVPNDLGLDVLPKKKRKTDEEKNDKNVKYPMRKKYYLLGSNTMTEEKIKHSPDIVSNPLKETVNINDNKVSHNSAVSAIDSLVKAAELLEHQSENMILTASPNPDSQSNTPVKRGRGRPRKYPLPEGGAETTKVPSPQKKPRLIDAKPIKKDTTTDDDEDDDDDDSVDQIIQENWTMGKINENIVCPICNKLFRTENVVFKHVKHCTGPSPSRSDSDKRSPRRMRQSQESDSKSRESKSDFDDDQPLIVRKETPTKPKSKDSVSKPIDKDDVIIIEDTPPPPMKLKIEKKEKETDDRKQHISRKPKDKVISKNNDLICEFCGKTFRQLSYLVNHKLQHKKEETKKIEKDTAVANKTTYSCEVCKKEFRKLHHLVQHRIIHNPSSSIPTRSLRKSSSEQQPEVKKVENEKEANIPKQTDDPSAGFRCEPCDKSFRKLHHLVEHRETHDGINRQKTTTVPPTNVEKPVSIHQCDVCQKTFRKLHHLIEHKELHVETSSDKSDDKSVKSSLSTRDIIHECPLCYMVFPNEHSLTKHTIICRRKKSQSKQPKPIEGTEIIEPDDENNENSKAETKIDPIDSPENVADEIETKTIEVSPINKRLDELELSKVTIEDSKDQLQEIVKEVTQDKQSTRLSLDALPVESQSIPVERVHLEMEKKIETQDDIKKVEIKETIIINETAKKKTTVKEKTLGGASKRQKITAPPSNEALKLTVESSDEDEVRYMLNPNFKVKEPSEERIFMKVRANKRSSLQIERPNSKDLVKRRTSLQHPPKIPRLKPKPIEVNITAVKTILKTTKLESVPSTDSDDSETIKYSFPKIIPEKSTKPAQERAPVENKIQKKISLVDKRKSLSGIAKRKSLGKAVIAKHKPSPAKPIKRRNQDVEHRCDCGQLFSSAALLSRHTTLAHTPPRIRRRRSPPPDDKPTIKPAPRKLSVVDKTKQTPASRKTSTRSDSSTSINTKPNKIDTKPTKKSFDKDLKTPADARKSKSEKSETKSSVKPKRTVAHSGVPVPEKMRKIMQKNKA